MAVGASPESFDPESQDHKNLEVEVWGVWGQTHQVDLWAKVRDMLVHQLRALGIHMPILVDLASGHAVLLKIVLWAQAQYQMGPWEVDHLEVVCCEASLLVVPWVLHQSEVLLDQDGP